MSIEQDIFDFNEPSEVTALRALLDSGTISLDDVANAMNKKKEEYVIKKHKFNIYVDSQGRWRTYFKEPNDPSSKRKTIIRRTKEEIYSDLYDLYTHREERIRKGLLTIEDMYDDWIEYKRLHGISESTIIRYQTDWKRLLEGTPIVRRPIGKLTKRELDEWAHKLIRDNNMTRTDYINVSTLIRQPLEYAVDLEIIDFNPMKKVKIEPRMFRPERKKSSESQVFTREEVDVLFKAAREDLNNAKLAHKLSPLAFMFMFLTGLRIGEVCAVRYEDIEGDELHLKRTVERDTHTIKDGLKGDSKERWVLLGSDALGIIEEARARQEAAGAPTDEYIFSMDGNYLPCRAVSEAFRKYCKRTGIKYRSSHKARKTYISTLIDAGMNINTIREMVGHADERTTMNSYCYDRRTKDERKAILEMALKS